MKNIILLFLSHSLLISCDKDKEEFYDYHAHIHEPDSTTKSLNDTLVIDIEFESHAAKTIHHVSVRVFEKSSNVILYNAPPNQHVFETDGSYSFLDLLVLNVANGFEPGSTYVLEAIMWGEKQGEQEEIQRVEFQLVP